MRFIIPDWPAPPNVRAASTLRTGGVSVAPYDSLNLGEHVGDQPQHVAENRRRVRAALGLPAEPFWLRQVHGVRVLPAAEGSAGREADASFAEVSFNNGKGAVCAVMTADCLPVLFASKDGRKVAAAHAGWRGLVSGVLEATIGALAVPPHELLAWLGPAISQEHFEVGAEVRDAFLKIDPAAESAFVPNPRGRWQADLYCLARQHLNRAGVAEVFGGGRCTFRERTEFFSHRRDSRGPQSNSGRMASLIWVT